MRHAFYRMDTVHRHENTVKQMNPWFSIFPDAAGNADYASPRRGTENTRAAWSC